MAQSLTRISKAIQEDFVEMVRSTFGDDLVSIVVYGSYLKETFTPGVSDVNILVVLSQIEPAGLERSVH